MKANELTAMSKEQLEEKVKELKGELFGLRGFGRLGDQLGLQRQLVAGQTERFTGDLFGDAGDFEQHSAGFNHGYPVLRSAFTGTHAGLGGLGRYRFVGENLDPYLTATLGVTGQGDTGRLDLLAGNPVRFGGLQSEFAVSQGVAPLGLTLHAAAELLAVFHSLGH